MLDPMLDLANQGLEGVSKNLGYKNIVFKKGYLERLPLEDASVDAILSNCVMNLSVNKRRSYAEIYRVLRPGGRLVISDVVCDAEPDPAIRNDEVLRGECIAGAMTQKDLIGILMESGFQSIQLIKRFPYREVQSHPFFSLTYLGRKPMPSQKVRVMYRGPLRNIVSTEGTLLTPGIVYRLPKAEADLLGEEVFILDENGAVTNVAAENTCACFDAPEAKKPPLVVADPGEVLQPLSLTKWASGCMLCGAPLTYLSEPKEIACAYCGKTSSANALCENGHFVCDTCHLKDGLKAIEHICLETKETDMLSLLEEIRRHPAIPVHGPEHHAMVPGIILATYRNLGGDISPSTILEGIKRGSTIVGGHCAFMGVCGAAVGVGISFSMILEANPLKASKRKIVQMVTQTVLAEIAKLEAARCCQRDSWIALKKAAELSKTILPLSLLANAPIVCRQRKTNKDCLGSECPLLIANRRSHAKKRIPER
jgi:SAM-dependent methyltransferase